MRTFLLLSLTLLLYVTPLFASNQVEVRMLRTISLAGAPKQVAATADGQRIYVLTEKGDILLFSSNGDPLGSFEAGPDVTGITPQGSNRLVLEMGAQKELMLITLEPVVQIATEGAPSLGPEDAPVTIVIFDDFECPYCARTVPLIKNVVNSYKDQVRLVFKFFPLGMHKHAKSAAIAAMAADRQGKFWSFHDLLFANYNKLSEEKITELAEKAGLDMERFASDRLDPRLQQKLAADQQEGLKIGVRGTPTIFINGRRLPQRSKRAFDQMIKTELAKATLGQ